MSAGDNLVWSRAGASIVFASDRHGSTDLYRVKAGGGGLDAISPGCDEID